jgi:homoserine O-acetyltransferase/O-succinyltransferase
MPAETRTHFIETGSPGNPVRLRDGGLLPGIRIAYETWGELNADKSNAIMLFHALSGSHHAAGFNPSIKGVGQLWQPEMHGGWWEDMIGPGKALDTDKYFIICGNYLGGCYGSTGPASVNPETGACWGSRFPAVTTADQVEVFTHLLDHLGIQTLNAVVGPSVGGLVALTFATRFPNRVRNVISIAAGFKTTVLNRLILFEQILAIENDPYFNGGDYYDGEAPLYGLALARMISHKTFVHLDAIERRARQDVVQPDDVLAWYRVRDQFQSYMLHQGKKFVRRFDANTYLRIIDMWSRYDATQEGDAETPTDLFERARLAGQRWLVFSIDSDFCFYPEEQAELVKHLETAKVDVMHIIVHSDKGHDSFLLEPDLYTPHIAWLLAK